MNDNVSILKIAVKLRDWKALACFLELSDATIEEIERDNERQYREQKFQCIKFWVMQNGRKATLKNLLRVMYFQLENKSLVMEIVQALKYCKCVLLLSNEYLYIQFIHDTICVELHT